ncbi:MAG: dihydropteroate synthase [Selenomonadales bacterium]|nr:dihydropteroate synthase [Selenomonadales bacterium]
MTFHTRVITLDTAEAARRAMDDIGCDPCGTAIMQNKALFRVIKVEGLATKAANILKQTMLAKGGEAAVRRGTVDLSADKTDVLLFGTVRQYQQAIMQLKMQPWGLKHLASELQGVLQSAGGRMSRRWVWADKQIVIEPNRTLVMGILNVTPDSFSDGGKYDTLDTALMHLEELIADGADIIDIGAESTRPYGGNKAVSAEEEKARLIPILTEVLKRTTVPVSVDTYKAEVADAALGMGAHIINDVWGLQYDDGEMARVAAKYDAPIVVMHNSHETTYSKDIISDLYTFFRRSIAIGEQAGVRKEQLILDPGIGFAKELAHNMEIMSRLEELHGLGCPLLLGTSRKRFIGEVLDLPADQRVEGTMATVAAGITKGVHIVRVHDVKEVKRMTRMMDAIRQVGEEHG